MPFSSVPWNGHIRPPRHVSHGFLGVFLPRNSADKRKQAGAAMVAELAPTFFFRLSQWLENWCGLPVSG